LITGFGVGWMVGLSVSPVVSIVITSVVGSVAGIVGGLSGLEEQPKWKINPWPIAFLLLGMVLGSVFGIQARTKDWFGTDISDEIAMWQATDLEIPPEKIAEILFERTYPDDGAQSGSAASAEVQMASKTVLFSGAVSADECESFQFLAGEDLRLELETSTNDKMPQLAGMINDDDDLEWIIKEVLCAEGG
jgi:hypothetical protein